MKAAAYFFGLSFLFLWRTWLLGQTHYPGDILTSYPLYYDGVADVSNPDLFDVINIFYPQSLALNEGLDRWEIPQWSPYSFCGHSLISNGHSGFYYPLRILCHALTAMPWAHDLFLWLHLGLAGCGMYALLRGCRLEVAPALLGASAFQFNGFAAGWLEHEHVIAYYAWLPLVLRLYQKGFQAPEARLRWWSAAAILLGMVGTVGMVQFWAYCLILAALWGLALWWPRRSLSALLGLAFSWVSALCVSSIALLPLLLNLGNQSRPKIPWAYQTEAFRELLTSVPLGLFLPDFAGNPAAGFHIQRVTIGGNWIYPESSVYIGLLPLALIPLAWSYRDRVECRFFCALPLGIILACATPLFAVVQTLAPGFDQTTVNRVLFLFPISLCALAAYGFQALLQQPKRAKLPFRLLLGGITIGLVSGATFSNYGPAMFATWLRSGRIRVPDPAIAADFPAASHQAFWAFYSPTNFSFWWPLVVALTALAGLALIQRRPAAVSLLVLLAAIDPAGYAERFNSTVAPERLFPETAEIRFLRDQSGGRVMSLAALRPNTLAAYSLPAFEGDESLYPKATQDYSNALANRSPDHWPVRFNVKTFPIRAFEQKLVDLAAVEWLVTYPGVTLPPPWQLVYTQQLQVFQNTTASPYCYWVSRAKSVTSSEEAIQALFSPTFDPAQAIVEGPVNVAATGKGEIVALQAKRTSPESLTVNTPPGPGWVVFSEGFHPGWTGREGLNPRPVYRANGMFMAIPVDGSGTIEMDFRPRGWPLGLYVSLGSLGVLGLLMLVGGPRQHRMARSTG